MTTTPPRRPPAKSDDDERPPLERIRDDLAGIKKLREFEDSLLRQVSEQLDRLERDAGPIS